MIAEPMSTGSTSGGYGTITASDLVAMEFAPARFVVPGLIGEGLTLLAGPPKIGKSMLMLHVAIAVATGGTALGSIPCKPANVCYVALEDGKRRVQGRLHNMIGSDPVPDRLSFKFECRRLDQGGFEELRSVCQARDVKLLIIDVLAAFRPPQGRRNYYEWDFRSLHELQQLATELGIAVVVVHHTRKASANDPLDRVSGTTGLTGAADTVMTLCRQRASDYVLEGRGRDIEAFEWPMKFEDGTWRVGDEVDKLTPDQQRVVDVLRQTEGPMSPKEVAAALGLDDAWVRQTLRRLADRDVIENPSYGLYSCHSVTPGKINH